MWDGQDRRKGERPENQDSHDTLIRIDANLSNFMKRFEEHTNEDRESFEKIDKAFEKLDGRTGKLEKFFYGVSGAFILFEIIMKLTGK